MNKRKLSLGNRNISGARIVKRRLVLGLKQVDLLTKLQMHGIDISAPTLSLLEGQRRPINDIELNAIATVLGVTADWLLGREE